MFIHTQVEGYQIRNLSQKSSNYPGRQSPLSSPKKRLEKGDERLDKLLVMTKVFKV